MIAPDPNAPVDPVVCINARMAGEPSACGFPESSHCSGCLMCPGLGNCVCRNNTAHDNPWVTAAMEAFAHHTGAVSWKALCNVLSHNTSDRYRADITAAAEPLLAEIDRLTAEVENLKHSKETS